MNFSKGMGNSLQAIYFPCNLNSIEVFSSLFPKPIFNSRKMYQGESPINFRFYSSKMTINYQRVVSYLMKYLPLCPLQ